MPPENETMSQNTSHDINPASGRLDSIITFNNIAVRLGDTWLLEGLSWKIQRGENWVVWGANGAGETTLAKALLGEAAIVQGSVQRYAQDKSTTGDSLNQIALVSSDQQIYLYQREEMLDRIVESGSTNLLYVNHRPDEMPDYITHQIVLSADTVISASGVLG